MENMQVIVVDDDPVVLTHISNIIQADVRTYTSTTDLFNEAEQLSPAAVFLDVYLNQTDTGLDVLPKVRYLWPHVPIVVMSSSSDSFVIAQALSSGANDFIRKPIDSTELIARLHVRIHECTQRKQQATIEIGDVAIDLKANSLVKDQNKAYLSTAEIDLIRILSDAMGQVVSRDWLRRSCWGHIQVSDNAIDRRVHNIRKSFKSVGSTVKIKAVYGEGFVLQAGQATGTVTPLLQAS